MSEQSGGPSVHGGRRFATTRWSQVLAAGQDPDAAGAQALADLCEAYWYPLYAYVRRWGFDADQAQDLTQQFFARLLEKHYLRDADPTRGRFRSFLLASLRHFLSNERDRAGAVKRGGRVAVLSLEMEGAEGRYSLEPPDEDTPERVFERRWAMTLLERTLARLRREFREAGKAGQLARLEGYLTGERDTLPYAELSRELGMSEGAIKVAVHRLRRRFGALLREEIGETVSDPSQVDDEIRELFRVLARPAHE
ncbi:MAG: sigma-70 family RNA polymerase sigma factor [Acidobacteria bacterium]|nr:MAG: sigma-70 family RNA polymerase sigma factor [Acidobacteriota bacterium]